MSARGDLESAVRRGFRAVMLSNHTAEKYASESTAAELRFLAGMFEEELSWREESRRGRLLKRAKFPVPKTFEGYDWSRVKVPEEIGRGASRAAGSLQTSRTSSCTAAWGTARPTWP